MLPSRREVPTAMLESVYQTMSEGVRSSESIHTADTPIPLLGDSLHK
jgi:hypothetical protein